MSTALVLLVCAAAVMVAYGWIEAGWLRTRVLEVQVAGLPGALEGVRIGHLSDFHLGARLSRGNHASARAVAWVAARQPDLVCVTGDLVSHPRGEARLRSLLVELDRPFVVLGNHDVAVTRDPFSRAGELRELERAALLRDRAETLELRGEHVAVVGVDPESYRLHWPSARARGPAGGIQAAPMPLPGHRRADPAGLVRPGPRGTSPCRPIRLPLGRRHLGIAIPGPSPRRPLPDSGRNDARIPGTGTTFVPFRLFARPEVTEPVLRRADQSV